MRPISVPQDDAHAFLLCDDSTSVLERASSLELRVVVRWVRMARPDTRVADAMYAATCDGQLEALRWLHENAENLTGF